MEFETVVEVLECLEEPKIVRTDCEELECLKKQYPYLNIAELE